MSILLCKISLIVLALILPFLTNAQSRWEVIRLDKISFAIPSEYTERDTLGQYNFHAKGDFSRIQVTKIPQPYAQIHNEKELVEYYKLFQKLTIEQSAGDLLSDTTITFNNLIAREFVFQSYWNDSLEVQQNMIIFIDRSMYSFTFAYLKEVRARALLEGQRFFPKITIYDTDFEDQLTAPNKAEQAGEAVGYIGRYVILLALFLAVISFFMKKYKFLRIMKRILSLIFLTWGAFSIFLHVGLLFFQQDSMLLTRGVVCLIIGFTLHFIRVPLQRA